MSQNPVVLVQFKCKEPPKSEYVRQLPDETVNQSLERRHRHDGSKAPDHQFKHTGVIPQKLMEIIRDRGLTLIDAYVQKRIALDHNEHQIRYHTLLTFRFSTPQKPPNKETVAHQLRVLQAYLDQRWERVIVASFDNAPHLQSILFVGRAENPTNAVPIEDGDATKFGVIVTRGQPQKQIA